LLSLICLNFVCLFFFSSRRLHTISKRDWSSDVCSSDLKYRQFYARYVVGADGANSTVRQYTDSRIEDLGFFYEWLVLDLIPDSGDSFTQDNLQVCDQARPDTSVSFGHGRCRFVFIRLQVATLAGVYIDIEARRH